MTSNTRLVVALPLCAALLGACTTTGQRESDADDGLGAEEVSLETLLNEGNELLRNGDLDGAQVSFALAVERDPKNVDALYKLGVIHYEKDGLGVAAGLLRSALAIAPRHQGSREALGVVLLKQERLDDAETILTDALESRPDSWQAMNALGIINDMRSRHDQAQEYFTAALFVVPRSAKVANNLGYSYYLTGDYEMAEKHIRDATRFDPRYVHAWSNLALLYARTGRNREARAAFDKVVDTHQAANNLGYLGLLQNDGELARTEFERAVRLSPSYYEIANENLAALGDVRPANRAGTDPLDDSAGRAGVLPEGVPSVSIGSSAVEPASGQPSPAAVPRLAAESSAATSEAESPATADSRPVSDAERRRTARRDAAPLLAFVGYGAADDDDDAIKTSVSRFQETYGLVVDGRAGPLTSETLRRIAATQLQRQLSSLGYSIGSVDGRIGDKTIAAIRRFQRDESLPPTGELDKTTIERLMSAVSRASERLNSDDRLDQSSRG